MEHINLIDSIHINSHSAVPKYVQLANSIVKAINNDLVHVGAALPTINELAHKIGVARDTVEKGYKVLKERKVILSKRGKGYFVADNDAFGLRIAVFMNKLSYHNREVYDSFVKEFGGSVEVDLFVYNSDINYLRYILQNQTKVYDYYVVFPHFVGQREMALNTLSLLPANKVVLMGATVAGFEGNFATIYENYENDIYNALQHALANLTKYKGLKLVFPEDSDYPRSIIQGFYRFCIDYEFDYSLVEYLEEESLAKDVCYISLTEDDLVRLFDCLQATQYVVGKDVGVISYNETPLKRYLYDGITTISTDFRWMGKKAAECIKRGKGQNIAVPFYARIRASV